jgi:OCT family organic cation transporter-like MFS transporter 18
MVTYGYLQTAFAALQLLGGPVYGRLGDMFGSRAVLVLANACGFSTYVAIAIASSSEMLFLSRIPGLLMHGAQGKLRPTQWPGLTKLSADSESIYSNKIVPLYAG